MEKDFHVPEKLLKPYNPAETESRIYKEEEATGYFNPDVCIADGIADANKPAFTILMPPPNANGSLHAGHALFVTLEDIMIRYARMQGRPTLWIPGADHAGFETQVVYEKQLEKEGRSRFGMKHEDLYREIYDFTMSKKSFMENQLRELGASCDWSRLNFTLDPKIVKTVYTTFKQLSDDGLLYRGARIVNWCPKHQTSLSNLETTRNPRKDKFYYFKYGPFTIGTARPETKFGDKYVVMHPEDTRYAAYAHGDTFEVEWINGPITATVIKDEAIDMEFGTGVMTITPWHDQADFDIAKRHNLSYEQVIDWNGKLLPIAGEFAGMKIAEAREKIVEKLQAKGLLEKIDENYAHEVPVCYKCSREIEPQIKDQWFVNMKPLAEKALESIAKGDVKILTEQHEKILINWLSNIQDWNISRQIAWGIPIPAKLCQNCNEGFVDIDDTLTKCEKCNGELVKDIDTFDTWFSSGQFPFAVLDFPQGEDFKKFYPTSVMETGADILNFWVARMLMLGLYRTGKVPFENVYLHGMVRDAKGQKMSKSKGNVISPIDVSNIYGTDALRMGLVVGNTPGTDLNLDPKKIEAYKKFGNKLWNITRFVLESTHNTTFDENFAAYTPRDQEHLEARNTLVKEITDELNNYKFHIASEKLYAYAWHEFADKILEESKKVFAEGTEAEIESRKQLLLGTLRTVIIILHPFMPFITEEVWAMLPKTDVEKGRLLMVTHWPHA